MSHWATKYVGKPWQLGAQGPDAFDCLGLVRTVYVDQYGVDPMPNLDDRSLETIRSTIDAQRPEWVSVTRPRQGDLVLMARRTVPVHVGVVVKADVLRCLHSVEPTKAGSVSGVVAQRLSELPNYGWGRVQFYRRSV